MKGFLKSGKVRVWALGDNYVIEMDTTASLNEVRDAVMAEEILDGYRVMGRWN